MINIRARATFSLCSLFALGTPLYRNQCGNFSICRTEYAENSNFLTIKYESISNTGSRSFWSWSFGSGSFWSVDSKDII